jgi:RNA polymerase sigma-70 factor (ECF subfamily)
MGAPDPRSDEQLLLATRDDPDAFAIFYRRRLEAVVGFFRTRVRAPELVADLTAETFAAALIASRRYRPDAPAGAWLFAIARHKLTDSLRHGQVDDRARRKLGMAPEALTDVDLVRVEEMAAAAVESGAALELLSDLPPDVREVLGARLRVRLEGSG